MANITQLLASLRKTQQTVINTRRRYQNLLTQLKITVNQKEGRIDGWWRALLIKEIRCECGCLYCGKKTGRLHFHHRDCSTDNPQIDLIARCTGQYTDAQLIAEIKQCDVVCPKCHKQEHIRHNRTKHFESIAYKILQTKLQPSVDNITTLMKHNLLTNVSEKDVVQAIEACLA